MTQLSISEVIQQTGLPASTLRYYEDIGLVNSIGRKGNRRQYDVDVLQRLALIQTGQQAGFKLAELKVLLSTALDANPADNNWHGLVQRKLREMDTLLENVNRMKSLLEDIMDCDDSQLAECIVSTGKRHRVIDTSE